MMSPYMRLKLILITLGGVFLVATGFNLSALPFAPDAFFSDAATSHWGAALTLQRSISAGEYPLWHDAILGGLPFAANPLNKTAYPLQWLAVLLPSVLHLNVMIVGHMLLAGVGMWCWARSRALTVESAALAALAYALAPRLVAHLGAGHVDIVYALAWLVWLMWLLERGAGNGQQLLYVLQLGLVAAMLLLADVRVSLFGYLFGTAYVMWRTIQTHDIQRVTNALAAFVVLLPLVAALLFPLTRWQPYMSRAEISLEDAGGESYSLAPLGTALLLLPPHESGAQETMVYVGLPVLTLAIVGLSAHPRRERFFWLGTIIIALMWSLGIHSPFWRLLSQLPVLRLFRVPARAWLIVVLIAPLLAGYGLQAMMNAAQRWREGEPPKSIFWLRLIAAGFGGMLTVCGASLLLINNVDIDLSPSIGVMLIVNGLGLALVFMLVLLRRGQRQIVFVLFMILTYLDLTVTGIHILEWRGQDEWLEPYLPVVEVLKADNSPRVYSPSYALPQQVAIAEELELFYGVDPFQLQVMVDAIVSASNIPINGYSVVIPPINVETDESDETTGEEIDITQVNRGILPDLEQLAQWQVTHIVAAYPVDMEGLTQVDRVNDIHIYRNEVQAAPIEFPIASDVIERLHRETLIAVWVSVVSFILVGILIPVLSIRERRNAV